MKFKLIWVGQSKKDFWAKGINDYLKRLKRYLQVELIEVKPERLKAQATFIKSQEAARIKRHLKPGEFHIALDERGHLLSTTELADFLKGLQRQGYKTISFFLGGPLGLAPDLIQQAHFCLSLSPLTLNHDLARVVLLEQLYRVVTIWHGEPYHK